jgi:hypothetical protein
MAGTAHSSSAYEALLLQNASEAARRLQGVLCIDGGIKQVIPDIINVWSVIFSVAVGRANAYP